MAAGAKGEKERAFGVQRSKVSGSRVGRPGGGSPDVVKEASGLGCGLGTGGLYYCMVGGMV